MLLNVHILLDSALKRIQNAPLLTYIVPKAVKNYNLTTATAEYINPRVTP